MQRTSLVVASVVLLHLGALWALQTGLLRSVAESIAPVAMVVEMVEMQEPQEQQAPQEAWKPRAALQHANHNAARPVPTAVHTEIPQPMEAPLPAQASANTTNTPDGVAATMATIPGTPGKTAPAITPATVPVLELPSSDADYLSNPKPPYPPVSKRLGEQGRVVVRVLIGTDGLAQEAAISQSSGFERLDQAALNTARKWRYVPGKRAGVAEAMWCNVPFNFVLE